MSKRERLSVSCGQGRQEEGRGGHLAPGPMRLLEGPSSYFAKLKNTISFCTSDPAT